MIGDSIRKIRQSKKFTQEELAALLHVTPQAVSSWEIGRTLPDAERIIDLAHIFDCSADEILGISK